MIAMIKRALSYIDRVIRIKRDPISYARTLGVKVGSRCKLGDIDAGTFGTEPFLIELGDHVEITSGVRFITHDGAVWVYRDTEPNMDVFGRIKLGNNVFVGMNSIILPGVTVGDNVIVGAGAVVSKSIPDGTVAVGVPAKPIGTVDELRKKVDGRAMYIRDMEINEKRAYLEKSLK